MVFGFLLFSAKCLFMWWRLRSKLSCKLIPESKFELLKVRKLKPRGEKEYIWDCLSEFSEEGSLCQMKVLLHNALDLSITSVFWANNSLNFSSRLSRSSCYGALIFLICNSAIVKGNNRAWTAQWDAFSLFNMLTLCANKVVFFMITCMALECTCSNLNLSGA